MILGRIAVGLIIFSVVLALLFNLPKWFNDGTDYMTTLVVIIMILIPAYCAISGTYLLYLGGKI